MESKHNTRELLLHITLEYYSVDRPCVMKRHHSGYNRAGGMFCLLCSDLNLGTRNMIGNHIDRSVSQVYEYIRNYRGYVEYDAEFKGDYQSIKEIFFTRERALFLDYYVSKIPKKHMAEFINYVAKFKVA